jgi:hypothetical protein
MLLMGMWTQSLWLPSAVDLTVTVEVLPHLLAVLITGKAVAVVVAVLVDLQPLVFSQFQVAEPHIF